MLLSLSLTVLAHASPAAADGSLLAAVPADAYVLVHCRDFASLRTRAERNDWYRLLAAPEGEPFLSELMLGFREKTHTEPDDLLAMARELAGEVVFFDTGTVAGFLAEPPANRAVLTDLMRQWMPRGDAALRRTFELGGGSVELVAWPDELDGWSGRAGHFAAFLDHPRALAIWSGDDSASVVSTLTAGVTALGTGERAPLVDSYLAEGGGRASGVELFVDFTPFVARAEAALKATVEDVLPDPTSLLGLEAGTWLHATADLSAGSHVDGRARLRLPPDTLAARLADTFVALPGTLPADLPASTWGMYALNWDLNAFYRQARLAYEEAGLGEGLKLVDAGIEGARGAVGVDPIGDVLEQLAGDFAVYFVDPAAPGRAGDAGDAGDAADDARVTILPQELRLLGFHAGLVDGERFLTAFERLIEVGRLDSVLDLEVIADVDAYVMNDDEEVDGGMAFMPRKLAAAPTRRVLELGLRALTRAEGAGLLPGSRMQAAIDGNAGACFLACAELTPLRAYFYPQWAGDVRLPPLEGAEEGLPARDPFDAQLTTSVRRTADGFELRIGTR